MSEFSELSKKSTPDEGTKSSGLAFRPERIRKPSTWEFTSPLESVSTSDHPREATEGAVDRLLDKFDADLLDTVTSRLNLDETVARIKQHRTRSFSDKSPEGIAIAEAAREATRVEESISRIVAAKEAQGVLAKFLLNQPEADDKPVDSRPSFSADMPDLQRDHMRGFLENGKHRSEGS